MSITRFNTSVGSSDEFTTPALDHVGGAQFAPQVPGKAEERQQLRQVLLQPAHDRAVLPPPPGAEVAKGGLGVLAAFCQINVLGSGFHSVIIALSHFLQNVAHLMHPATLMPRPRIDGGNRRRQTRATVGDDQRQMLAFQPAPVQVPEQPFPVRLTLAWLRRKASKWRVTSRRTP